MGIERASNPSTDLGIGNNILYSNGLNAVFPQGQGIDINAATVAHSRIFVTNNVVAYSRDTGISIIKLKDSLVRNNTVYASGADNGIFVDNSTNLAFRNNISYDNANWGIFIGSGATNIGGSYTYNNAASNGVGDFNLGAATGDISTNPAFVSTDPASPDFLHLNPAVPSRSINAGDPADPVPPNGGCRIDQGAYEFYYTSGFAGFRITHDGTADVNVWEAVTIEAIDQFFCATSFEGQVTIGVEGGLLGELTWITQGGTYGELLSIVVDEPRASFMNSIS